MYAAEGRYLRVDREQHQLRHRLTQGGLVDGAPHRAPPPTICNRYTRGAADPAYDPATEAQQALFRPLFTTSFLLDGSLDDNDFFGVGTVVLTSASSKTSYGLAHLLRRNRSDRCRIVRLRGASIRRFVEGLGCYDQVVGYDEIAKLAVEPVVVTDIAGDSAATKALHDHFHKNLKYNCAVGASHWETTRLMEELQGAAPRFFFAPDHAQRMIETLRPDGFQASLETAWGAFMKSIGGGIQIVKVRGHEGVAETYAKVLEGKVSAATSYMLSLWP